MSKQSGAEQLQGALDDKKKNASLNAPPVSCSIPEPQEETGQSRVTPSHVRGPPSRDADIYQRPLSYPIAELPAETGVSRSQIYEDIRKGHLITFKVGGRRYARLEAVLQWMADLEAAANKSAAA